MENSRPAPSAPRRGRAPRAAAAAALLLAATAARAEVEPLAVDARWDLPVTAAAALGNLVLSTSLAKPGGCRWCDTNRFDAWTQDRLRWSSTKAPGTASDVLVSAVIPLAVAGNSLYFAAREDDWRLLWEDGIVIAEAVSIAGLLNGAVKDLAARRRPDAGPGATGSANRSFYSGHATLAFSLAAAAGTVSTLRGYESAPWVWAGGMTLAAATGYLRLAADVHWGTDVLVGAAVSGVVGWAVPWVFHRVRRPRAGVAVLPSPNGFAVVF